jgi:hypothetical protein
MRMFTAIAGCAVVLAGCTQQQSASNDFKGAEKTVAQVVLDLSSDAGRSKTNDVCGNLLSKRLQESVTADSSCTHEVKKAFEDADNATLKVEDVTITQNKATAEVSSKDRDTTVKRTFKLVLEDGTWRIDSFG